MELVIFLAVAVLVLYLINKAVKYFTTPRCPKCKKVLSERYKLLKAPTPIEDGLEEKTLYCECGYEKKVTYSVPYWKLVRKEDSRGFEVIPWTKLYEGEKVDQATAESEKDSKDSEESPNTTGQGAG